MSDLDILNQIIKDTAKVRLTEKHGRWQASLDEPEHRNSSINISGVPQNAIVIKVDKFPSPAGIFNGTRGECKRADYAIVAEVDGKTIIIYIELKLRQASAQTIIQQLKGAQCFMAYCMEIGKAFWAEQGFLKGHHQRFVGIGHTSIAKRPTRFKRQPGKHDQPEKMLKVDWPHHLEFNKLAGL